MDLFAEQTANEYEKEHHRYTRYDLGVHYRYVGDGHYRLTKIFILHMMDTERRRRAEHRSDSRRGYREY